MHAVSVKPNAEMSWQDYKDKLKKKYNRSLVAKIFLITGITWLIKWICLIFAKCMTFQFNSILPSTVAFILHLLHQLKRIWIQKICINWKVSELIVQSSKLASTYRNQIQTWYSTEFVDRLTNIHKETNHSPTLILSTPMFNPPR